MGANIQKLGNMVSVSTQRNILHLIASEFFGGPERQILGHAITLPREYGKCIISSFIENGKENAFLKTAAEFGVQTFPLPVSQPFDHRQVSALCSYIKSNAIDLLCAHGYRAFTIGLPAAKKSGIPVFALPRGWTSENLKVRFFYNTAGLLMHFADAVVAVSQAQAADFKRSFFLKADKIHVIYNAIDTRRIDQLAREKNTIRHEFGISHDTPLVVCVGRLSPEKGHRYLIEAVKQVVRQVPHARFLVVGDGQEKERLQMLILELGITESIQLIGFRNDPLRFFIDADSVVLPSLSEGMPNVLLEAAAASCAAVSSAVGGAPEVIEHGETGLLVPPKNPAALADALREILCDPHRRKELGAAARKRMEQHFRFQAQTDQFMALYEKYLGPAAKK